ncbi:MAG: WD40 repeat domain-containing protein [Armatimonadota bacterium]|nr:MAG: WD40 repeat domain-containing protein [Armatimonadota bacterium]
MDDPTDAAQRDNTPRPARQPEADGIPSRRLRIFVTVVLAAYAVCLFVAGFLVVRAIYTPRPIPRADAGPIQQPGGTLRQIAAREVGIDATWSADGTQVVFDFYDDRVWRDVMDMLSGRLPMRKYLAVTETDGESRHAYELARGISPWRALWRPGTSTLAVSVTEWKRDGAEASYDNAIRLFDLPEGRLSGRIYSGDNWLVSWSPDGRLLLCMGGGSGQDRRYWLLRVADRRTVDIALPEKPAYTRLPCWSPDSRSLAFGWLPKERAKGDLNPVHGLWIADADTGQASLQPVDFYRTFAWLPDGRMLLARSRRDDPWRPLTNFGFLGPGADTVEWLPTSVPGICLELEHANGRTVVDLSGPSIKERQWVSDLYELTLPDCAVRRLTDLDLCGTWQLSPRGDRVLIGSIGPREELSRDDRRAKALPRGIWVLDIDPRGKAPGRDDRSAPEAR